MYNNVYDILTTVKRNRPLILNMTNNVTMDFIANGLLCIGASPIMNISIKETDEFVGITDGIMINIGTLNDEFIASCERICMAANRLGKPLVLDPVGAGASSYRTQTCIDFLNRFQFSMVRGNASEIMALSGFGQGAKGVDTNMETLDVVESAQSFSSQYKTVTVVSGKTDAVIEGQRVQLFERGSSLMPMVTGTGCLLTATLSAFETASDDCYTAACAGVVFYGISGELAASRATEPGSFRVHFLNELSKMPQREHYE